MTRRILISDVTTLGNGWYNDFLKVCALINFPTFNFMTPISIDLFKKHCHDHANNYICESMTNNIKSVLLKNLLDLNGTIAVPQYLTDRHKRSLISKLLLGILKLAVETGRYSNIPRNERICHICKTVEDEYHFIFDCKMYNIPRQLLVNNTHYLVFDTQSVQFSHLYNFHFKTLCKYVLDAWTIRQKALFNNS